MTNRLVKITNFIKHFTFKKFSLEYSNNCSKKTLEKPVLHQFVVKNYRKNYFCNYKLKELIKCKLLKSSNFLDY